MKESTGYGFTAVFFIIIAFLVSQTYQTSTGYIFTGAFAVGAIIMFIAALSFEVKEDEKEEMKKNNQSPLTSSNAKFCPYCGAEQKGTPFCGNCGKKIE